LILDFMADLAALLASDIGVLLSGVPLAALRFARLSEQLQGRISLPVGFEE
jgi:hypothetical protein